PPTETKARTGEFTPEGITARARSKSSSDAVVEGVMQGSWGSMRTMRAMRAVRAARAGDGELRAGEARPGRARPGSGELAQVCGQAVLEPAGDLARVVGQDGRGAGAA